MASKLSEVYKLPLKNWRYYSVTQHWITKEGMGGEELELMIKHNARL